MGKALACLGQGKLVCVQDNDTTQAIKAIQAIPTACESFMSTSLKGPAQVNALPIRYAALKPLIYAYKDRGLLGYSNPETLRKWDDFNYEFIRLRETFYQPDDILQALVAVGQKHNADCMLLDLKVIKEALHRLPLDVLYQNPTYILVKLHPAIPNSR